MIDSMENLESTIAEQFDVPKGLKQSLREGFEILGDLPESQYQEIVKWALRNVDRGMIPQLTKLSEVIKLDDNKTRSLSISVMMIVYTITTFDVDSSTFTRIAHEKEFLTRDIEGKIKNFCNYVLKHKSEINRNKEIARLSNKILPSLFAFEITIDARFEVKDGKILYSTPIAVCVLNTDVDDERIWFQMTKEDIRELKLKLETALDDMETIEKKII